MLYYSQCHTCIICSELPILQWNCIIYNDITSNKKSCMQQLQKEGKYDITKEICWIYIFSRNKFKTVLPLIGLDTFSDLLDQHVVVARSSVGHELHWPSSSPKSQHDKNVFQNQACYLSEDWKRSCNRNLLFTHTKGKNEVAEESTFPTIILLIYKPQVHLEYKVPKGY